MRWWSRFWRRNKLDRDLSRELQFHIEERISALASTGLSEKEARRQVRQEFGGIEQVKEECRDARGFSLLETTLQEVRYAFRGMRRSPLFTFVALAALALTTGTVSTVLTLTNTFFLRRLPVDRPEQLVAVTPTRRHGTILGWLSYPDYVHFRDHTKTLQGLAAHYSSAPLFVSVNNKAKEINGAVVSGNFFPLLGLQPVVGRFFRPDEDSVPDRDPVAVLAYDFWQSWFDSSPQALGTTIKINGTPFTVIGVAPKSFPGMLEVPSEVFLPTMMLRVGYRGCDALRDETCTPLSMIGRLAPGVGLNNAKAEMATLVPPSWAEASEGDNTGAAVFSARGADNHNHESYARFVKLLFLAAGVLFAVCCANLAGLLTARAAAREREFAIRASLGAARFRLVRQLITESVLLALIGGVLGTLVSAALTHAIRSMFYSVDAEGHPIYYNFSPDPLVILAVLAISVSIGLLFGLIPAIQSSRRGPAESLKGHASTLSPRSRLAHSLVGTQAAFAVTLLITAGLLVTSTRILARGISFEPSHVALMRLRPGLLDYPPPKAQRFLRSVIQKIESVPGVESASMIGTGVVLLGGQAEVALPEARDPKRETLSADYGDIGPFYFTTLRTPVVRGREFDDRDVLNSPSVAIVNQTLARRLWPSREALNAMILVNGHPHRVVGVVQDAGLETRAYRREPYVYVPYWQNAAAVDARLCIRVHGDPAAMLSLLTREVHRMDPNVPIAETITLPIQLNGAFQPLRMSATFISYIAALSVLLCAIGIYGTLAFAVSRRTKEIGIRMALGAEAGEVRAMVVREELFVILLATVAGIGLAAMGERLIRHLLLGSASADVFFYSGAALLVVLTAVLACWIPARRAASVEPLAALRQD